MRELIARAIAMLALINVAEAVNMGRRSGFNGIIDQIGAFQWSAILDSKTCPICRELDGKYFEPGSKDLEALTPPIHPSCRCILVAVLKDELERFPVEFARYTDQQIFDFVAGKFW